MGQNSTPAMRTAPRQARGLPAIRVTSQRLALDPKAAPVGGWQWSESGPL